MLYLCISSENRANLFSFMCNYGIWKRLKQLCQAYYSILNISIYQNILILIEEEFLGDMLAYVYKILLILI